MTELIVHCFRALYAIEKGPKPSQEFNPGVTRKLVAEGYATRIMLPTPYSTRKGSIGHLQITEKGKRRLERNTP